MSATSRISGVFISSTRRDFDQTGCRKKLIDVVQEYAYAVEMEKWAFDSTFTFEDLVATCHSKVQQSSHFLGLIGHRHGWKPDCIHPRSITEAEFDHASQLQRKMQVFLPHPLSDISQQLKQLSEDQPEQDTRWQQGFVKRIRDQGIGMEYEDQAQLIRKSMHVMNSWQVGGLRELAASTEASSARMPDEHEFSTLGRSDHYQAFQKTLDYLATPDTPPQVCFVVQGPVGFGHREFIYRIREDFASSNTPPPRTINAVIGASWRAGSNDSLLEVLAKELGVMEASPTIDVVAEKLSSILQSVDVLLELHHVHRFENATDGLIAKFWQPLVQRIPADARKRLMLIASEESSDQLATLIQPPITETDHLRRFDPQLAVQLPVLQPHNLGEISRWLCKFMPLEQAQELAKTLFNETEGNPALIRQRVYQEACWA